MIDKSSLSKAQTFSILAGAAVMLSLAMGMRQSFGLLQISMIRDVGITAAEFSLAIAIQNIIWGVTQPFVGIMADRHGARPVAVTGVAVYGLGLLLMRYADANWMVTLGMGVCIGLALSCTASNIAMNVTARTVSVAKRSVAMGAVSAAGSLGLTLASPMAQGLMAMSGWRMALVGFLGLACVMLPAALMAGKADQIERDVHVGAAQSVIEAVREALGHKGYRVLAIAFFVCGLQLVFITTHLPTYLDICGLDPSVGSTALALVGLFNVLGSYLFGWLGGVYSKRALLGGIYLLRSLCIAIYFSLPPTPASTLVFAAAMGTLWLGVVPLVSGLVVHLFGLRYMATLSGIAFFSHQVGSFLGAWGGGLIYSSLHSYDLAWQLAVAIGVAAGLFQMSMNVQPSARLMAASAQ
ncbi:MAG: MFS transporter [Betaproteobacteria bacterium]|jgi:predicted MFS family arabinose efflux permease|nr:MFS transporter [Betaproteobacteria bacterium]